MKRRKEAGYANSFRYLTKKEEETSVTQGEASLKQCRAFAECVNTPGPNGYCEVRLRRRKQVRMTPSQIRAWWKERSPDDLNRLLGELGVSGVSELASFRLSVAAGGVVVSQRDVGDASEAFSETLPKGND